MKNHTNHTSTINGKTFPWPLLWLILLFTVPLFTASWLYHFREAISFKIIPHGQLLTPPILAESLGLLPIKEAKGKWQLVFFCQANHRKECAVQYDLLKRIHLSLGKDQNRVHLSSPTLDLPVNFIANLKYKHNHNLHHNMTSNLTAEITEETFKDPLEKHSLLLIDPHGFVMMHYSLPMQKPKELLEDIRRLLRFSHVG